MKLDERVVDKIIASMDDCDWPTICNILREKLENLDLVFKPGDASQSILVENRPENKDIDRHKVYRKEK